ncbi:hypothetical protein [Caballeronia sp. Lep1P3]|uniref:hypothetical protein n=1 Tax=Caballeronia sp. Lep1P3 TaxID=2878150 RepID=UPI001FD10974|nr:hypothetical protein [Caballeronia sp. Lep1P3]
MPAEGRSRRELLDGTRVEETSVLTPTMLHEMQTQVLELVAATGQHSERVLELITVPYVCEYRSDGNAASLERLRHVPLVFQVIEEAWSRDADDIHNEQVTDGRISHLSPNSALPNALLSVTDD